jgi:hypothetical protein
VIPIRDAHGSRATEADGVRILVRVERHERNDFFRSF